MMLRETIKQARSILDSECNCNSPEYKILDLLILAVEALEENTDKNLACNNPDWL